MRILIALAVLFPAFPALAVVNIDWVTVGDPGNSADTEVMTCCGDSIDTTGYGSVGHVYRIGKYEVTNAQYAEFLNAVAATDTYFLYDTGMGSVYGGITQLCTPSCTYSTIAGRESMPVNYVSFYDALRFANWLHNGQPVGAQDSTTTEDGAYTIDAQGITDNSITRNEGARVFLPSEDEWYKAAYYDTDTMSYFDYPAGSNTATACEVPGVTANIANCDLIVTRVTKVGIYTGSPSPNGSFDQGGNVWEWNEAIVGSSRARRGGSFVQHPDHLAAFSRVSDYSPTGSFLDAGFRVATPPQFPQGIPSLSPIGLLLVAAGLLGFSAYCRGRA